MSESHLHIHQNAKVPREEPKAANVRAFGPVRFELTA